MKKINHNILIKVLSATLCFIVCSCNEQLETLSSNQEKNIEKYLNAQVEASTKEHEKDPSYPIYEVVHNNGVSRLITKKGSGDALKEGGSFTYHFAGYEFITGISSEKMFATNDSLRAKTAQWDIPKEWCEPRTTKLDSDNFISGLFFGLQGVQTGEECQIVFNGKYGFGNCKTGVVPANAALIYCFTVKSVTNQ